MTRMLILLLAGAAAVPAFAQTPAPQPDEPPPAAEEEIVEDDIYADDGEVDEAVVVQAGPPRGSVIGDIPPENRLDARDIRATGATSIDELLEALAPQIGCPPS